ncbi:MAG: DNA-processing protein DprA [Treponema sp.]|jgi:DNA processing protein|nr:DNA-processing protein DprA [Treponema sp.]
MGDSGESLLALGVARLPIKARGKIVLYDFFSSKTAEAAGAAFFDSSVNDLARILGTPIQKHFAMSAIRSLAEKDAELAGKRNIRFVSRGDPAYPPLLLETYDPPVALFYRGKLPDPDAPLIAVVGTRRPSPSASASAFNIARELGGLGYSVVSGLALGVDAMAHRGCLEANAPTFAVLGSSPDEVYPTANRVLARRVLERGGGLLSEYQPGTRPAKWRFPARNRIISALARGTLVVEAPEKSGALITARFALEQNRDLWVVLTGSPVGKGSEKLAEQGAKVITSATGILKDWGRVIEKNETNEGRSADGGERGDEEGAFSPENSAAALMRDLGI